MAVYYAAVEGDPLTTGDGSYTIAKHFWATIDDGKGAGPRRMIVIGDEAFCSVCQSIGEVTYGVRIRPGGRTDCMGRDQAVGGDLVNCNCSAKPRIHVPYGRNFEIIDNSEASRITALSSLGTPAVARSATQASASGYDEQVRANAAPALAVGYPYLIETTGGQTISGRTDSTRCLPRIYADRADTYAIHWGDEALAHEGWQ